MKRLLLLVLVLSLAASFGFAQLLTNEGGTSDVVVFETDTEMFQQELPDSKVDFWKWGIAAITPFIIYGISRIPKLPKPVLPTITPIVGILLGLGLKQLDAANLSWVDMGEAGALAVFIREVTNQWVTKQLKTVEDQRKELRKDLRDLADPKK